MDHSMHGMMMDLPPFTLGRAFSYSSDPFFLVCCSLGIVLYGWGVLRLRRRGDAWSPGRSIAYVLGVLMVAVTMCTGLNDYGMVMFSVHMVQHMIISMVAPILLLLGAPVTLALRTLPVLGRGRKGPRELLLMLLHSRFVRVISHPAFTIPVFIASLYGLYFTPIFDFLMRSEGGHILMMVHFLAVGLLFFWPIMGVDPGPHRSGHLMRMLELFAGMPFHAFFGIALMMASQPMIKTYDHPAASLGIDALSDQTAAGGIAWGFSEVPSVLVLIALVFQWYRSDQRQAVRTDRAADRDGDKELAAYNAYLASLQTRSR
ncbi:cytochrome c oxidase assembly protein [Streptomyces fuscigenes]|uniref:cytochrome c oxidase assembly protein n=1 Tax=Streptomyces fuscigenes TaxID=1528880 RepID=UPI001F2B2411|nr:cytochrome c oxidase assembly protein [Streptomyces fuscigenes]MCF3962682.1 cytochrome c oxidase assembly protein [Streptomyces fuscigenes]